MHHHMLYYLFQYNYIDHDDALKVHKSYSRNLNGVEDGALHAIYIFRVIWNLCSSTLFIYFYYFPFLVFYFILFILSVEELFSISDILTVRTLFKHTKIKI